MAYQSQIINAGNQAKWAKLVPQGGLYWDQKNKAYFFRDPTSGKIKYTSDLNTAYSAAGIQAGETPVDAVIAKNQAFKFGGAQIQYDAKSKSYYFKDPVSGKILTTPDLATAYGIIAPKTTTPSGSPTEIAGPGGSTLKYTGDTPESGFRPSGTGKQFFQPVYQPTYQNYAREGYSLMGDQSGLGALQAVLGQNTAGTSPLDMSAYQPRGIGQIQNPFAFNPFSYRSLYETSMGQAQRPAITPQATPAVASAGLGTVQSPFSTGGTQGAFGGGFGGTSLYTGGK